MDTTYVAVDGWVDAIPTPGPRGTATFDLIVCPPTRTPPPPTPLTRSSPAPAEPPQITHALLTDIQPGDLLRVTGSLVQPLVPGEAARLTVDVLEVLDTALIPVLNDMVLDRYGDYVVIFDADRDQVPVFTALGQWVGTAENPDNIATLIDIHERVNGGDA
ncbi:hypothetical protein OG585_53185 (plasmid) [Streptomyces sp. NBC_01340]|uniref:hypothetical protein n=1 Tax=unclassified Streptomyces TaxID=2593676 RepID=UPI00225AA952|nr:MULTISPECIES: hypothetical protein [unclassified Streptomyces]MCX4460164.1 hypothetical protein [Streptomyces sp. NBC_01719]MCX4500505.1 hypothetical protein [Streptomyces sp. NBC_01728]WSI45535.1 hypothetical protein OG585_53185 [Streptomyces sp. NBC_01340]